MSVFQQKKSDLKINSILIIGFSLLVTSFCISQCTIDSIIYKEFSLLYIYEKSSFSNVDSMLLYGKPTKNWKIIYENGKIKSSNFGNTFGGQNRVIDFSYYDDGRLKSAHDNGRIKIDLFFEYLENGNILLTKFNNLFGEKKYKIKIKDDSIDVFNISNKVQEFYLYNDYSRNKAFKYGNIDFLDDTFDFINNVYEEESEYIVSTDIDHCKNITTYQVKIIQTNKIFKLQKFQYFYK